MSYLIDTHCHLDFPDFIGEGESPPKMDMAQVLSAMEKHRVGYAVCISVTWEAWEKVHQLALSHENLFCTVGVHPDYENYYEPSVEELMRRAQAEKVVAIGECGLDYHHCPDRPKWQEERFVRHIHASRASQKPLVIHSRDSGNRLIEMLKSEQASVMDGGAGGVLHCFTDTWEIAKAALDLGFYLSFSGIVTFKNAKSLQEVAAKTPADRYVIETDAPFLAPHPHRGALNHPAYVDYVAQSLAVLRGVDWQTIATESTQNAKRLFNLPIENNVKTQ